MPSIMTTLPSFALCWFTSFILISNIGLSHALAQDLAGPFDFSSSSQYNSNFVTLYASGSTLAVNGGQLVQTGSGTCGWVYDTTPDSMPTNMFSDFCVTARFTPQTDNDSFGFYFYTGNNRAAGAYLAIFNVNKSGSDDQIRFISGASLSNSSVGATLGIKTLAGGGFTTGKPYAATLVVTPVANCGAFATLVLSDPSGVLSNFMHTQYLSGLGGITGEIGFRSNKNATGSTAFDNIAVRTPLPITVQEAVTSSTAATIRWSAYTGTTYYRIYRDGTMVATVPGQSYTDYGPLDPFKSYEYQVVACDSNWQVVTASPLVPFAYRRFAFVTPWDDASTGTVADLSDWSTQSASQRITLSNGHFFAGGQRLKLLGVNFTSQSCFPAKNDPLLGDVAAKLAARLAKLGVNCVRLIGIDLATPYGCLQSNLVSLDSVQMDKLDYFIYQLKQRGIYVDIVLHGCRRYPGYDSTGLTDMTAFHGVDLYHPGMIQLQKEYATALLSRTNPYTNTTYANEPAIALIEINNENGLIHYWRAGLFDSGTTVNSAYLTELQTQWNNWLQTKYGTTAALATAWAPSAGQSYGTSLISNGNFASGFVYPHWYLQVQSTTSQPVAATVSLVENGSPDGTQRAVKISVTQANIAAPWRVQLLYTPVDGTSVSPIHYTARFWAKSDSPRTISVGFQQNHANYNSLGGTNVNITSDWRQYTVVIPVTAADNNALFIFGNLGKQTGELWLADVSLVSGNTLLGIRSAWAEGQFGDEKLANGTFSGTLTPWFLQSTSPASGSATILPGGAPDGSNALRIDITTTAPDTYKVQLLQTGQTYALNQAYTLTFQAKASSNRTLGIGLQQNHTPWLGLAWASAPLTTEWQTYTVVIPSTGDESNGLFAFTNLASDTGSVWFANVSMKPGAVGKGLLTGEVLGSIASFQPSTLSLRSRAAQRDWLTFLWETEKNYWTGMRNHIKTTLGSPALVIGSQANFTPALIQAEMDVVDYHCYWQHPQFPGVAWDIDNWFVKNLSMAGENTGGAFSEAALHRVAGKPFICTEYNTPSPITYGGETLLIASAYAAMQDWDGVFVFGYEHGAPLTQQYFTTYFQIAQEPTKQLTLPISASILRQGTVASGSSPLIASLSLADAITMAGRKGLNASVYGIPALSAMVWPTALQTASYSQVAIPYMPASTTEWISASGQLTWDTSDKLTIVNTPKTKIFAGRSNNQSYDFGDGVIITPGPTMQPGNWCALSLMAKDGTNFQSAGKILITATGYTDNHRMLWKTGMGPLDATSSIGANWGQAPTLAEGIDATITLPAAANRVTVWSLDTRGQHRTAVPVTDTNGKATFSLSRTQLTLWYEVIIAP